MASWPGLVLKAIRPSYHVILNPLTRPKDTLPRKPQRLPIHNPSLTYSWKHHSPSRNLSTILEIRRPTIRLANILNTNSNPILLNIQFLHTCQSQIIELFISSHLTNLKFLNICLIINSLISPFQVAWIPGSCFAFTRTVQFVQTINTNSLNVTCSSKQGASNSLFFTGEKEWYL